MNASGLSPIVLQTEHLVQMLQHIESCYPEEACGLLVGKNGQVNRVFAVENEFHSPMRFRMNPQEQLNVLIWADENDLEITGIFHSHPSGPPVPSETDISLFYYPGSVTLIWAKEHGQWYPRAFQISGKDVIEVPIAVATNNATS